DVDSDGGATPDAAVCNDDAAPIAYHPHNNQRCAIGTQGAYINHGHNTYTGKASRFMCNNHNMPGADNVELCIGGSTCGVKTGKDIDDTNDNADIFGNGDAGVAVPAAAEQAYEAWGSPTPDMDIDCFNPPFAPKKTRTVKNVKTEFPQCTGASD